MYKMYDTKLVNLQLIYGIAGAREKFEELCVSLMKSNIKHRNVNGVRANPGDGGIDIFVGNWTDNDVDVYQCKYFINGIGESQKDNIRKSFKKVIETVSEKKSKINTWYLCLPIELTNEEKHWFDIWKQENEINKNLSIKLMDAHDISIELMKPENFHIYSEFFKQQVTKPVVVPTVHMLGSDYSGDITISNLGEESAFNVQLVLNRKQYNKLISWSDENCLGHLGRNQEKRLSIGDLSPTSTDVLPSVLSNVKDINNDTLEIDIRYINSNGVMFTTRTIIKIKKVISSIETRVQVETYIQ
jgi:hypothetical protein